MYKMLLVVIESLAISPALVCAFIDGLQRGVSVLLTLDIFTVPLGEFIYSVQVVDARVVRLF